MSKALDILAGYTKTTTPTDQSTYQQSGDSASSIVLSPLQKVITLMMEQSVPPQLVGLARKILPDLDKFLKIVDDPIQLHTYVSAAVFQLQEVLKRDHEYIDLSGCQCTSTTERSRAAASTEGVPDGHDRVGEVYVDGSVIQ